MLTPLQALRVVTDSIRKINGRDARPSDRLKQVGFPTNDHVDQLRDVMVNGEETGVKRFNHITTADKLRGIGPSNTVAATSDEVLENSDPIPSREE